MKYLPEHENPDSLITCTIGELRDCSVPIEHSSCGETEHWGGSENDSSESGCFLELPPPRQMANVGCFLEPLGCDYDSQSLSSSLCPQTPNDCDTAISFDNISKPQDTSWHENGGLREKRVGIVDSISFQRNYMYINCIYSKGGQVDGFDDKSKYNINFELALPPDLAARTVLELLISDFTKTLH